MSKLAGLGSWWRALGMTAPMVAALSVSPVMAQERVARDAADQGTSGREHEVRKGDTLWDLAGFYLKDPFNWGAIFEANRGVVKNPHLIYPKDRLVIPGLTATKESPLQGTTLSRGPAGRTIFYSGAGSDSPGPDEPDAPTAIAAEEEASNLVVQPGEYLAAPWLVERGELRGVGSVLRLAGHEGYSGKVVQSIHSGDRIYLRRSGGTAPEVGDSLLLVNEGRRIRGWGRVASPSGIAIVESIERDVIQVTVREQFDRIVRGDVAIPVGKAPTGQGRASPVTDGAEGKLLGFTTEQPVYDPSDLGFIDLGSRSGVVIGDELEVYLPERSTGGWTPAELPEESVARLRVVRVEDRTATVRLIGLGQGKLRSGLPVRVVGKMP